MLYRVVAKALSGDIDIELVHATRIIDVWVITDEAQYDSTLTVQHGDHPITDAMLTGRMGPRAVVRARFLDARHWEVEAEGCLRVRGAHGGHGTVFMLGS